MKDILFKLKVLLYDLIYTCIFWKEQVWKVPLDDRICCNGYECGCMGSTFRQEIEWTHLKSKKLRN